MSEFDARAEDYDTAVRAERAQAFAREIRAHVAEGRQKTAIEFGCGTGLLGFALLGFALLGSFRSVTFVDSSAGMIRQVEQKLERLGLPASGALCCDIIEAIPQGLRADCVFSSLVLHHIADTQAALRRLFDLLNPGGQLLLIDLDTDDGSFHAQYPDFDGHNGFDQAALCEAAKGAGFSRAESHTFYRACKRVKGEERPYSLFLLNAVK